MTAILNNDQLDKIYENYGKPTSGEKISSLELKDQSTPKIQQNSETLSKDLAISLMKLIDKVNEGGVTPETVNASCNAASQIYKILRLNFDIKKAGF